MGQSHKKSAEAPATAPARGKDAATLNPHLGPALKTHPSWSLGRLPRPEARGPQAEHGEAGTFCPIRTVLPNLFTPPEFQHLRHKTGRAAHVFPAQPKRAARRLPNTATAYKVSCEITVGLCSRFWRQGAGMRRGQGERAGWDEMLQPRE